MRFTNVRTLAVSGVVTVLAATGCASGDSTLTVMGRPPVTVPAVAVVSSVTELTQVALPMDSYVQSPADRRVVLQAEFKTMVHCMARFGLTFDPPNWDRPGLTTAQMVEGTHARLYGLFDLAQAKKMGYHVVQVPTPQEEAYSAKTLPAGYANVAAAKMGGGTFAGHAIPSGGCIGEARRSVGDIPSAGQDLVDSIPAQAWQASQADSRVKAAFAAWSACMSASGYQYSDPMAAIDDPRWAGPSATGEEISVAVADVHCKQTTNMVGTWMAVDASYQRRAMSTHASELTALVQERQAQLTNAVRSNAAP